VIIGYLELAICYLNFLYNEQKNKKKKWESIINKWVNKKLILVFEEEENWVFEFRRSSLNKDLDCFH